MNDIAHQILEDVEKLPLQMQKEALDFVRSLTDKQKQSDLAESEQRTQWEKNSENHGGNRGKRNGFP